VAAREYGINRMPGVSRPGLGKTLIHFGGNSGYQAMNLAYLWGVKKMILLGFDMKMTHGMSHFFGDHPYHKHRGGPNERLCAHWVKQFEKLAIDLAAEGIEVINASRHSALKCFPREPIELC
jgi:hypothetical protein